DTRDQRRETGIAEAHTYIRNIGTLLNSAASDIDSYMSAGALVIGSSPQEINNTNTAPYLAGLQTRYPNLSGLFITDLNGKIIAQTSGQESTVDVSNRPYMKNL